MAWQDPQPRSPRTQERRWIKLEGEGLHPSNAQSKEEMECREREPKCPFVFHAAKVKHLLERTIESDKHGGNSKVVKAKKVNGFKQKWSIHTGPRHHLLVPSQYMRGGPQVKGIIGCGLAVGRKRESILGFPLKLLWGEMSYWDGI